MQKLSGSTFLISASLMACFSCVLALSFGSVTLHFTHLSNVDKTILFQLRFPEVFNAFVVGALLALSGLLLQALLENPLADPYILGTSGGAAVATLIGLLFGLSFFWLHSLTYLGAILAVFLVFGLARTPKHWSPIKLLLTGVVLAAAWGAIISFILIISPSRNLDSLLFWLIGNVQAGQFSWLGCGILLLGFCICLFIAAPLDLLLLGHERAQTLGINRKKLYVILYLISALLTATAVSIAGTIGFVGLIVPHLVRLSTTNKHRILIPGCVLIGGSLLVLADLLARTIIAPEQLPVGIFTVLIGVPIFLSLLLKRSS